MKDLRDRCSGAKERDEMGEIRNLNSMGKDESRGKQISGVEQEFRQWTNGTIVTMGL